MGSDMGIRLELDATAAKGILDRQGIAEVRRIDINCVRLQRQCAKKILPLTKIPGEENTADLMTKHHAIATILRHMTKLNLEHIGGRSDAAAKLHLVMETQTPVSTTGRLSQVVEQALRRPTGDYWADRGEHGRWARIHLEPGPGSSIPEEPRGPGRKARLCATRGTQGTFLHRRRKFRHVRRVAVGER